IENGYFHSERPEMMKYIPEGTKRILDVGCSDGGFCKSLMRSDREIWGVEMNEIAAQKATEVCTKVLVGDFNAIYDQLPKNHFDCIFFNDVLEHIYAPWDTIKLVKSLLSPTGVIISSIPNFRYIGNLITEVIWEGEIRYKPEGGILDDTHIRFFTPKSMCRMYREQGYEVLLNEGINPCKSWKEKLFINLTFGFLKDARYKQFVTVAKPIHS
ncbi:MAG TPA: class I SAM-dependent methyltransferase, partial [Paludibacter sp.]